MFGSHPPTAVLMLVGFKSVTKHGRSCAPLSGCQSTACPPAPATEVNVPHSWTMRSSARLELTPGTAVASSPVAPAIAVINNTSNPTRFTIEGSEVFSTETADLVPEVQWTGLLAGADLWHQTASFCGKHL